MASAAMQMVDDAEVPAAAARTASLLGDNNTGDPPDVRVKVEPVESPESEKSKGAAKAKRESKGLKNQSTVSWMPQTH